MESTNSMVADFLSLAIRDYMTKSGFEDTLMTYLLELKQKEMTSGETSTWYEISNQLKLPELLDTYGDKSTSTLMVLVKYVIDCRTKEIQQREPPIQLIATAQKKGSMRLLSASQPRPQTANSVLSSPSIRSVNTKLADVPKKKKILRVQPALPGIRLKKERRSSTAAYKNPDLSKIPTKQRKKMISRELQNLSCTVKDRENTTKRWQAFEQRNKVEEALEESRNKCFQKRQIKCMLCTQVFKRHQLQNTTTYKAIMDVRYAWDPQFKELNPTLTNPPMCYDKVRVCVFCSQFVSNIETYRPSMQSQVREKQRNRLLEEKRKKEELERIKNRCDPLNDSDSVDSDASSVDLVSEKSLDEDKLKMKNTSAVSRNNNTTAIAGRRLHYSSVKAGTARSLTRPEWKIIK